MLFMSSDLTPRQEVLYKELLGQTYITDLDEETAETIWKHARKNGGKRAFMDAMTAKDGKPEKFIVYLESWPASDSPREDYREMVDRIRDYDYSDFGNLYD